MKLWSINKWLRWTGFRLGVLVATTEAEMQDDSFETEISLLWGGLYGSRRWQRWEPGSSHWTDLIARLRPLVPGRK